MMPAETMPPMTAPNGNPQNISATRVPRSFAGAYSEVTEMMPGNAPPRPNPVTSLTRPKTGRDEVRGVIDVVAANNATAAIKAGLRPNRSPQMPNTIAPTKLPNIPVLGLVRLVTGFSLGGALPGIISVTSEYA